MQVYLDNNATTMVDPLVVKDMNPFFSELYGNPNSLHKFGTDTHPALAKAINQVYTALNASDDDDIVFTSCATESNNWVLKSIFMDKIVNGDKNHIITTEVEHPSVLSTCKALEEEGLGDMDAFISVTPNSETNIISSLVAKKAACGPP